MRGGWGCGGVRAAFWVAHWTLTVRGQLGRAGSEVEVVDGGGGGGGGPAGIDGGRGFGTRAEEFGGFGEGEGVGGGAGAC